MAVGGPALSHDYSSQPVTRRAAGVRHTAGQACSVAGTTRSGDLVLFLSVDYAVPRDDLASGEIDSRPTPPGWVRSLARQYRKVPVSRTIAPKPSAPGRAAASDRALVNASTRQDLVDKIIVRLAIHAELAEEIFYPAVRSQVGAAKAAVLEAVEEHHVAEALMGKIKGLAAEDETVDAKVTVLIDIVLHHKDEEEQQMFPLVRDAFPAEQPETPGQRLDRAKRQAADEKLDEGFFPRGLVGTVASLVGRAGRLPGAWALGWLWGRVNIARVPGQKPGGAGTPSPR
jgi:hemerythrin superfamily protein